MKTKTKTNTTKAARQIKPSAANKKIAALRGMQAATSATVLAKLGDGRPGPYDSRPAPARSATATVSPLVAAAKASGKLVVVKVDGSKVVAAVGASVEKMNGQPLKNVTPGTVVTTPAIKGTPQIKAPRSAVTFTVVRPGDGKKAKLPVSSLKPILQNETKPYTIQFHNAAGQDVEGLYTVAANGDVTQAESKQVTLTEAPAPVTTTRTRKATVAAPADGFPANGFDRACWEEVIKGGTAEQVATRVVARFTDEKDAATKKYRTNPANVMKYHADYVKEVKAAGLLK